MLLKEKYSIGHDSLLLATTQFLTLGINMINSMLLSRYRTLGEYGTYSQLMTVSTVLITFFSAGFSQCINYFLGKSDNDKRRFIKNYYSIISVMGIAGGILGVVLLPLLRIYFTNQSLSKYWYVLLLYPISHILISGSDRFFIAYGEGKKLLVFKVGHSIIVLIEIIITIYFQMSFFQYMVIYSVIELVFGLSVYLWIKVITGVIPIGLSKVYIKKIFVFAIPMALASLVSTLNTEIDKILVGGLVSTDTYAIYSNAARELPVYIISTSISSVVMPHVVRNLSLKDITEACSIWKKSILFSFYLISFCVSVLFVFAPQIISILYSDKFLPGVSVFRVYSLVLLFRITYYGMMLNSLGKTKLILRASVLTMVSNLLFDILLYKLFGIIGPAIATLISVSVMNMYQIYLTSNLVSIKICDILPIKRFLHIIIVNIALAIPAYVIQQMLFKYTCFDTIITTIAIGIVWLSLYFCIIKNQLFLLWRNLNTGDVSDD